MINKIFSYLIIGGLITTCINGQASAQTVNLEKIQDPELSLSSINKDVFTTTIPATFNLTLSNPNDIEDPNTPIPVTISITKPFLTQADTSDPGGTILKAFVSFTDNSGGKTLSSDTGSTTAIFNPGTTKLTVTIETDRPIEYFGGSYSYDTTLTVDSQ